MFFLNSSPAAELRMRGCRFNWGVQIPHHTPETCEVHQQAFLPEQTVAAGFELYMQLVASYDRVEGLVFDMACGSLSESVTFWKWVCLYDYWV